MRRFARECLHFLCPCLAKAGSRVLEGARCLERVPVSHREELTIKIPTFRPTCENEKGGESKRRE
jgi:hypothetical protein